METRASLSAALEAQLRAERAGAARSAWVHLTALLSAPLALLCIRPDVLSSSNRVLVLLPWIFSAVSAWAAHRAERRWRARRDERIADYRAGARGRP